MNNTLHKSSKEISNEKGKKIVIAIILYFVFFELLIDILNILNGQGLSIVSLIRFVITIIFCTFFYKGHNWAKVLLAFGAFIGIFSGIYTLYLIINNSDATLFNFISTLLLTILSGLVTYCLIFSSDIYSFMVSQNPKKK